MVRVTVFLWCSAGQFLEQAVEIRIVVKTQCESNVFHGHVVCDQYKLGFFYFLLINVL